MKLDRLLSLVFYLLNREYISASKLAKHFDVSVRTIQRDIEALSLAGIPIVSIQGPNGGYGIMESWKMDRQLISNEDLYYIITALKTIGSSINEDRIEGTLEKMKNFLPENGDEVFRTRNERLHLDFSMLGGKPAQKEVFQTIKKAVDSSRLVSFDYTNNKLETVTRLIEPMTLVFRWRDWYLYGYCRLRESYRIFRLSRIRNIELKDSRFQRRNKEYSEFQKENTESHDNGKIRLVLRFNQVMKSVIEDFYDSQDLQYLPDGRIVASSMVNENGGLYGYILSYGQFVEVLEPDHIRQIIKDGAEKTAALYNSPHSAKNRST